MPLSLYITGTNSNSYSLSSWAFFVRELGEGFKELVVRMAVGRGEKSGYELKCSVATHKGDGVWFRSLNRGLELNCTIRLPYTLHFLPNPHPRHIVTS